ncbi:MULTISPECIES: Gfo/Idh/MocA family protein [Rhodopirellula]|jgi:predicted dehydrogenase|uniref:Oxidoreductase domain protein n=1 Tax=Rhodopirellula europaea SH398 TaxID=1263868 RepID=M5SBW6_9BACT|nr:MULTISPECIES: Gfo/Idh/MocA family oxidoreductase [Rhodopirellula]EMI29148.1 oxidoreductase domain protein [Rhodopirellula europaea SH398]MCR9207168.1 Gfo/Idh/MocA family oxidoreductase [bacterium]
MTKPICRWGILGAANIARKNWKAIRMSGNGVVTAVASRDVQRAEGFIHDCSLECPPVITGADGSAELTRPEAIGDYQTLLDRDDIDAVYIALPTTYRKKWVLAAAAAGKHVIAEKPFAVHADDAIEMADACREAGVNLMDGVMFDHSSRLPELKHTLTDPVAFGDLKRIQTHFSFCGDDSFEEANIRASADLEPHGALGDLGWYCIRFTLWAAGDRLPTAVSGQSTVRLDEGRVPGEFQGEMRFDDGLTAGFFCSFFCVNQQTATLSGNRGYATLNDFVLPFNGSECSWETHQHELIIDNCRWNFGEHSRKHGVTEHASGEADSQETRMFRHFADEVLHGRVETRSSEIAVKTQQVLDALRRSDADESRWVTL